MSGDFLDQCDEEAVGMKNAWKQAECALGCEAVLKVLRTGGSENAFTAQGFDAGFKRKQAVVGCLRQHCGDDLLIFFRLQ